jgi:hypothetical protein
VDKLNKLLTNHIANWNMVWFGLIFWGSIFNSIASNFEITTHSLIWYCLGLFSGIIAKIRGTWLWKV